MATVQPDLFDLPMSLGDHLHELRRRLIFPIVSLAVLFLVAFIFEGQLKILFFKPMMWALEMDPIITEKAGIDPKTFKLQAIDVMESMMASMSVCFYASIFFCLPYFHLSVVDIRQRWLDAERAPSSVFIYPSWRYVFLRRDSGGIF